MESIKNNADQYKKDAKAYFDAKVAKGGLLYTKVQGDYHYQVATNLDLYSDAEYIEGDFKETLKKLTDANPLSQLTEEFKKELRINVIDVLKEHDSDLLKLITFSDAGSVKIGNGNLSLLIPNGYGDGETVVLVTSKNMDIPMKYFTMIKGEIDIYNYDCGNEVDQTIKGKFSVYSEDGTVVFNKMD